MKKYILYTLTIILTVFFMSSCCKSEKTYTIKDKLRFNENDRFVYKSNFNNYDTLYISEIYDEIEYHNTSEGICNTKFYKEHIRYYYQDLYNPFDEEKRPFLELTYNPDNNTVPFWAKFYRDTFGGFKLHHIDTYYSNDSIYTDVREIVNYDSVSNDIVYKYFFNKKYGFLSYKFKTGEKYYLLKYTLADE